MAIITFSGASPFASTPFPIAALRDLLTTNLSGYKWQCGEEDHGGKTDTGRFLGNMLISGRSFDTIVFTELRAVDAVLPDAPSPHLWYLDVGTPTTDIQLVADRITMIICITLMAADKLGSRCRLFPGEPWLTAENLQLVFERVLGGEPLSLAAGSTPPPRAAKTMVLANIVAANEAEAAQDASGATPAPPPTSPRRPGGFGRKGL
jgi:hypothetical protein